MSKYKENKIANFNKRLESFFKIRVSDTKEMIQNCEEVTTFTEKVIEDIEQSYGYTVRGQVAIGTFKDFIEVVKVISKSLKTIKESDEQFLKGVKF